MKLTVQVKLVVDSERSKSLEKTIRRSNAACDWLSELAWSSKTFSQFRLHQIGYRDCRSRFTDLSSQVIVRCNAKVADSYKIDRKKKRTFKPLGSIGYDARILSWRIEKSLVSIWTVDGRLKIPFVCGEKQKELLNHERGEADLVHRDGKFFLCVSVDIPDTKEQSVLDWLGVDLGVAEIATTSDGQIFAGETLNHRRSQNNELRKQLQSKGTRSSKRLLRKRRRKESRFSTDTNHMISKRLVETAKRTGRGIALEDLKHIRSRARATRDFRRRLHSWAFADLAAKIKYKASLAGVPVVFVDPRNTSRTCPLCGCCSKANRRKRDKFKCRQCGYEAHADTNGAENIRRKAMLAAINQPNAPGNEVVTVSHVASRTSMEPEVANCLL